MQLFCMHKTTRASQKILETVSILLDLETKLVSAVAPVTLTAVTDRKFKKKKKPWRRNSHQDFVSLSRNCWIYGHICNLQPLWITQIWLLSVALRIWSKLKIRHSSIAVSAWCSLANTASQTGFNPLSFTALFCEFKTWYWKKLNCFGIGSFGKTSSSLQLS